MATKNTKISDVVIKFAGDSGDGMQLTGTEFSKITAEMGNDVSTFPDFPAEIRAPQGTLAGVSGFQVHFSDNKIYTPGDHYDVLVAMNAAALKSNLPFLKKGGIIILNIGGMDSKNLRLANISEEDNPISNGSLDDYSVYLLDITKLTKESLQEFDMGTKEKDRAKNMFVLGLLYWMYNRNIDVTIKFLEEKFKSKPLIRDSNITVLQAGYNFGVTTEIFASRYEVDKASMPAGTYRSITGNKALSYGIVAASELSGLKAFLGTYPITPASDILHELSKMKNFDIVTFQAEDEIAGIAAAIGASYGGNLGFTSTSGPGMALKTEAMGLAMMLELPLVVINVQRGGPSTGLPTKTEQSDLLQAIYGRNGESPIPVIAASTPTDCFDMAIEAARLAVEHMTPVVLLSDGYIANGAQPWKFPKFQDLEKIHVNFAQDQELAKTPYLRDEDGVRPWIKPGTSDMEHRIGGLEKQENTGNVSYDPVNHEKMTLARAEKINKISDRLPPLSFSEGGIENDVLVLGWGGTYGAIKSAVRDLNAENRSLAHLHLNYLFPFQKELKDILKNFDKVIIPELNNGQLSQLIRNEFLVDVHPINKIKGLPFFKNELKLEIVHILEGSN